ncbi:MAG: hypothetical protein RMM98_01205 [Acidobacteriota bacterium]|nr:hypothetical protein [Blastocatellia bacterium]MDW8238204.1 hypothetical protein [Acidobacteriota bacterium]
MRTFLSLGNIVVLAFALSGAVMASQKSEAHKAPGQVEAKHATKANMRTVRGEITAVNTNAETLTLMERGKAITFAYNNHTEFTEAGRRVEPSAIKSGMKATVKYTEREGKNWAHSVDLRPAQRASATKKSKP